MPIRFTVSVVEGIHLLRLVDDLYDLVGGDRDLRDPAIARLTPTPYPDDGKASTAFADATRTDLLDRRLADAAIMRDGLSAFDIDPEVLSDHEAIAERDIVIENDDVEAWMRTYNTLRLVIATRLGIVDDEDGNDPDDARYDVYDWLGYRLEVLLQAADDIR